jgi:hypothetical protein
MQQNSTACPRGVHVQMRAEVEALLWPAGIEVDWRDYDPAGIAPSVCALLSLRFTSGQPAPAKGTSVHARPHLGWTHITDGDILPYCVVDYKSVKDLTARFAAGKPLVTWNDVVGRALGRVVAHEIYHVVARTTVHSSEGAAKACLSVEDLTAQRCCFDQPALERLRRHTAGRICLGQFSVPVSAAVAP